MRFLKRLLPALCVLLAPQAQARGFETDFADSTIRLDYVFGGTNRTPDINLARTLRLDGWSGRRHNLDRLPLAGNGRLTVTDPVSGDTLYRTSFSSLYNEWLVLDDSVSRAFEVSVLMPSPKHPVKVDLHVYDNNGVAVSGHRHYLDPADILIRRPAAVGYDTVMVHRGNFDGNKIQVVILPEGFRADEMDKFHDFARRTVKAVFAHEPFGSLSERFDFIAVDVPSRDSDVSVPKDGIWRDTAFGSHFSTFYSDRYLTTPNVFAVHDALVGVPYEHIIILANTDVYGGGGIYNSYTLTTTGNPKFEPVVVHEFGHSFGGLADEYFYEDDPMAASYPAGVEPWEPNITTLADFGSKWRHLLKEGTPVPTPVEQADRFPIGVYEGAGYAFKGVYRPADYCRMRVNDIDHFCPACQDALARLIHFYTD